MRNAIIWTQADCKYCNLAKRLLLANKILYIEKKIGLGGTHTKKDLLDAVPHARTVPQIFLDGEYIGGYEDLVKAI